MLGVSLVTNGRIVTRIRNPNAMPRALLMAFMVLGGLGLGSCCRT